MGLIVEIDDDFVIMQHKVALWHFSCHSLHWTHKKHLPTETNEYMIIHDI